MPAKRELEIRACVDAKLPFYVFGYEVRQELIRADLMIIFKKYNEDYTYNSRLPKYNDDAEYRYAWTEAHLGITYVLNGGGNNLAKLPLTEDACYQAYYGDNYKALNQYESGYAFTQQELIDLLNRLWIGAPLYLENENTTIEYRWEEGRLYIDAYFENEHFTQTMDRTWNLNNQGEFDHYIEGCIGNNLDEPNKQYYKVHVSYYFDYGLDVFREEEVDNERALSNPVFEFKDSVLKSCIANSLKLSTGEISTRNQMRSLLVLQCKGVTDLYGLESWNHLKGINLNINSNIDLNPLITMQSLQLLMLTGNNNHFDLSQLKNAPR